MMDFFAFKNSSSEIQTTTKVVFIFTVFLLAKI